MKHILEGLLLHCVKIELRQNSLEVSINIKAGEYKDVVSFGGMQI